MASAIRVRSALACDDIRTEESGKLIAIGITNPIVSVFPEGKLPPAGKTGILPVHFLLSLDVKEAGEHDIEFRVKALSGRVGSGMAATVLFNRATTSIPFPLGPLRVPIASGERGFSLEQKVEQRWKRVATWTFDSPVPAFEDGAS